MNPIKEITGKGLPLPIDDIDTDRIIPSRFLRTVTFEGIGDNVFRDERFDEKGNPTSFPMNNPAYKGTEIIVATKNFGCGSSREHAPQAIKRAGFKAVIAESFAEIFFGNSTTIGLPCVVLTEADIKQIMKDIEHNITVNLETKTVECNGKSYSFGIPETARQSLLDGSYDLLPELMRAKDRIAKVHERLK